MKPRNPLEVENDPFAASYAAPNAAPAGGADLAPIGDGVDVKGMEPSGDDFEQPSFGAQAPTAAAGGINPATGTVMGDAGGTGYLGGGSQAGQDLERPDMGTDQRSSKFTDMVSSVQAAATPEERAVAQDALARTMFTDLKAYGHDVKWDGDKLMVDGRPYVLADGAPTSATAPKTMPRTGPTYTPGEIDTLDGFDPMAGAGDLDGETQALIRNLLRQPSALDDRMVDTLKAKSREEASALAAQEDDELQRFGFANGISDSRWLASERAANARGRDEAVIRSNRDIDITAANQRREDERATVATAQSYLQLKGDNAFRTAALKGDRLALRETVNARAAELGLSGDQMQLDYTMGLIDDATRRYGIDEGMKIDREKLAQAGREFQEELAFKFAQLEQQDAQFGASYGLDLARFNADEDQRTFDNAMRLFDE